MIYRRYQWRQSKDSQRYPMGSRNGCFRFIHVCMVGKCHLPIWQPPSGVLSVDLVLYQEKGDCHGKGHI